MNHGASRMLGSGLRLRGTATAAAGALFAMAGLGTALCLPAAGGRHTRRSPPAFGGTVAVLDMRDARTGRTVLRVNVAWRGRRPEPAVVTRTPVAAPFAYTVTGPCMIMNAAAGPSGTVVHVAKGASARCEAVDWPDGAGSVPVLSVDVAPTSKQPTAAPAYSAIPSQKRSR